MITIKFYLRSSQKSLTNPGLTDEKKAGINAVNAKLKKAETFIELRARYDGYLVVYNTGIKILPKDWDAKRFKIKPQSNRHPDNELLQHIEKLAKDVHTQSRLSGVVITPQEFRDKLNDLLKKKPSVEKTVIQYFSEDFIKAKSEDKASNERVSGITALKYKTVINHLIAYQEAKKLKLGFDGFTSKFYNDFVNYLSKEYTYKRKGIDYKGLEDNTVGNTVKFLKTFLKWAFEENLHKCEAFRKFKVIKYNDDTIDTLTDLELHKIKTVTLTSSKLQRIRDMFIVGLAVGARISDLLRLSDNNLVEMNGFPFIKYVPLKTIKNKKDPITVPINAEVLNILKKYEGQYSTLLPKISDVKFNKYLKELGKVAGLDNMVEVTKVIDGKKAVVKKVERWQTLSSHIMRRTLTTSLLQSNIPQQLVMEITGHTDNNSFKRYVNMADPIFKRGAFEKYWSK